MSATAPTMIIPPQADTDDVKALTARTADLAENYDDYAVATAEEFQGGAEHLRIIKSMQKELETQEKAITKPMNDAKAAVINFFRPFKTRLAIAESAVKRGLTSWKSEQDRIAREKQREVDELARKERVELEKQSREADEKGRPARAANLEDRAAEHVAPIVESEAPKTEGVSFRKIWKFRITNESKIPREYLKVDTTKIGGVVRALKGDASIAGVEIYSEDVPAAKAF